MNAVLNRGERRALAWLVAQGPEMSTLDVSEMCQGIGMKRGNVDVLLSNLFDRGWIRFYPRFHVTLSGLTAAQRIKEGGAS